MKQKVLEINISEKIRYQTILVPFIGLISRPEILT